MNYTTFMFIIVLFINISKYNMCYFKLEESRFHFSVLTALVNGKLVTVKDLKGEGLKA